MLQECDTLNTGLEYDNNDQCNDCVKVGWKAFTVDGIHQCYPSCNNSFESENLTPFCHVNGVFERECEEHEKLEGTECVARCEEGSKWLRGKCNRRVRFGDTIYLQAKDKIDG